MHFFPETNKVLVYISVPLGQVLGCEIRGYTWAVQPREN